ncbi:MAG: membrane protein insertase YidC [Clostridiales bacterium]|nr:membrane protein insertase YidC [Clostridiales bacterium]
MSALYTLFIYPLELFFEVVFSVANRVVGHPGLAIIILSLAVNFLVLPLYKRADEVQREERDLEAALADGIAHIKKTFKGDERMMMLNTYYAQNNYSPLYVLRGSVSLLLQIPFFMAAYRFLSNLKLLRGVSFGPIADLGAPDQMFVLFGFGINILPILMTLINFISGYIYTKGMPLKSKVQLYGMALVFLVLLYNSPSGLAFYWTLNNVFSMLKNVFYRFKRPGFALACVVAGVGALLMIYVNTIYDAPYFARQMKLTIFAALLLLPLLVIILGKRNPGLWSKLTGKIEYSGNNRNLFILSGAFLSLFIGLLIPSAVVKSSPTEFIDLTNMISPNSYIIHSGLIAAGFFLVWGGVFFYLSKKTVRVVISLIWWALCPSTVITYLFFGTQMGTMEVTMIYLSQFQFSLFEKTYNLLLILGASLIVIFLFIKLPKFVQGVALVLSIVCVIMSAGNMNIIRGAYIETRDRIDMEMPVLPLSRDGRNVMVLMIDRAPGFLVPVIFNEIPELAEQFDGFTYYPNTLSFGAHTKHAAPALFGGYDYTPGAICADESKTLRQTQNESLTVMPLLFRNEGFEVTLFDPPFAGYMSPPDLRVFDAPEFDGINAYITDENPYISNWDFSGFNDEIWNRNFFCYSVFKASPLFLQGAVYNRGNYNIADPWEVEGTNYSIPQIAISPSCSTGVNESFMDAYSVLDNLIEITQIEDGSADTFMYIDNETAHSPILLSEPGFVPAQNVDNTEYDLAHAGRFDVMVNGYSLNMNQYACMSHYESNVAAYLMLGRYFDYLREEGLWDNTRIIVVADHGTMNYDVSFFGDQTNAVRSGMEAFNPVLMVKDFGSTGGFTVSEEFMTNADVPYIATAGIIDNPANPYTGNPLITHTEYGMPMCVYDSWDSNVLYTEANGDAVRFIVDEWYSFDGVEIINEDSWESLGRS